MSFSKQTKAELLEMLSSKGIEAKQSTKKAELIELLENAAEPAAEEMVIEASAPDSNNESDAKPSASLPVSLVVWVFVTIAILAWIIL